MSLHRTKDAKKIEEKTVTSKEKDKELENKKIHLKSIM